jgi:NAD(P)-dependent dehydrogenase (short-subunit alcohol dehydrogenase family)
MQMIEILGCEQPNRRLIWAILQGKVAVVTGEGAGVGQGIVVLFDREGARVVVADLAGRCDGKVGMIRSGGGEAICVPTDVTEVEAVDKMVNTGVSDYGRLDIIVNNAGIAPPEGLINDCSEEAFDRIVAVNLKGVWLVMKYAIPIMLEAGGGTIINIASNSAFRGALRFSAYTASRGR